MPSNKWSDDVRNALKKKGMDYIDLAKECGYSKSLIKDLLNGNYYSSNIDVITEKINKVCNTKGRPPIDHNKEWDKWRKAVKKRLIDTDSSIKSLSAQLGLSNNKVSMVMKGRNLNEEVANAINKYLNLNAVGMRLIDD